MDYAKQKQIRDFQECAIYMRNLYLYNPKLSEKTCKEIADEWEEKAMKLAATE